MDVKPGKLYGVISGDLVGSSKLPANERETLFQVMQEGSRSLKEWLGRDMPLNVDIYSGDSWQSFSWGLAVALLTKLAIDAVLS